MSSGLWHTIGTRLHKNRIALRTAQGVLRMRNGPSLTNLRRKTTVAHSGMREDVRAPG